VTLLLALATTLAHAGPIAVVDFQLAVTQTTEGKAAQSKIDQMYTARKAEIDKLKGELDREIADYQSRSMILSESARTEAETGLMAKQQRFEQMYMQYQEEIQQTYGGLLQQLDVKMRTVSVSLAREKGYDIVLDKQAVVYSGASVVDMTPELVVRYNQAYK
jgi:outer membrane protein